MILDGYGQYLILSENVGYRGCGMPARALQRPATRSTFEWFWLPILYLAVGEPIDPFSHSTLATAREPVMGGGS